MKKLTLFQLFLLTILAVTIIVGLGFTFLINSTKKTILANAAKQQDAEAKRIEINVNRELNVANSTLNHLEKAILSGVMSFDSVTAPEKELFIELLNHPTISDITFTHAQQEGFSELGEMIISPQQRWQISVFRTDASHLNTRIVSQQNENFEASIRERSENLNPLFNGSPFHQEGITSDPTMHPTFKTITAQKNYGHPIWSDFHWSELDEMLPEEKRHVVVTVQKAIRDSSDKFIGVLRIGLNTHTIDELPTSTQKALALEGNSSQAYRVFLTDPKGRLLTRPNPTDNIAVLEDDLRIVPKNLDPVIASALLSPSLNDLSIDHPSSTESIYVSGQKWLVSFRLLQNTQNWIIGIAVPEDFYTQDLRSLRNRFLWFFLLTSLFGFITGGLVLRQLKNGLGSIMKATSRMRALDFTPTTEAENFRDIAEVQVELERAKTSMRALGKYVPLDLVRNLYKSNREPSLGGELNQLSILFTDIQGFTSIAEKLHPERVAEALGYYLREMTAGVQSTGGTVDKFIGDAVMAFWNAPNPMDNHPLQACRSVLECMQRVNRLYSSPEWKDLPPLITRFGLHLGTVMVGHFGAPDRFEYTALGDGVNLASRLEGLCKHYGIVTLASEAIVKEAKGEFAFRLIDKVAVKGKIEGVRVYELLGTIEDVYHKDPNRLELIQAYETALEAYFNCQFETAIEILAPHQGDPPSANLSERCKHLLTNPPPEDWKGVYIAKTK